MDDNILSKKLESILSKLSDLEDLLGDPNVVKDQKRFRSLTQEHAYLQKIKETKELLDSLSKQLHDNRDLLKDEQDAELVAMLVEDSDTVKEQIEALQKKIETLLVPQDPNDNRNTILELRAGTGGDEASLFVADCLRMYQFFADKKGWRYEGLSATTSEKGGFKDYVMALSGPDVHRFLQYEAGTHRVQRVPETETQGRVHTSAITIAVLVEPDEDEEIVLEEKDLKVDTYRASGAGGQHVNVTDSAVRITHIPSGAVVTCQDEKSQHKNKQKALRVLSAKLLEIEQQKKHKEMADTRASQVGSGDRSERIRTYNFSQNRITDHRINYTRHNLDQVMDGDLEDITETLVAHYHQKQLENA